MSETNVTEDGKAESTRQQPNDVSVAGEAVSGAGITAGVVGMVLFARLLAVSGWNWETAADIADSFDFSDAVPIMLGTLFELPVVTGVAAAVILPFAIYRLQIMRTRQEQRWKHSDWFVITVLISIIVVLIRTYEMWWTVVVAAVLFTGLLLFSVLVKSGELHRIVVGVAHRTGTILITGILILAVTVTTPWNVREKIETNDGVIVGHVLDTTPGFVKVLTDEKDVVILLTGDVVSRTSVGIDE